MNEPMEIRNKRAPLGAFVNMFRRKRNVWKLYGEYADDELRYPRCCSQHVSDVLEFLYGQFDVQLDAEWDKWQDKGDAQ